MAGAGYKLFNTGDVLTAAQVNTYLMEQSVMVFANAAARTTALSGVVAEGMLSYLKDTDAVEVYNGTSWVASDDPNAIQNTIVDAKGDLITATADNVPARLAVGSNGDTLLADSSTSTGLKWASPTGPAFRAYRNGAQTITANVATKIALNAETFDTDNCFDATTNYRFTPTKAGKYLIQLNVIIAGAGVVNIYKNGSNFCQLTVTSNGYHCLAAIVEFNGSSDYVEFYVNVNGTTVYSGTDNNFASGVWIRS